MINKLQNDYFNWMVHKLFSDEILANSYFCLLDQMNQIPFEWTLIQDENRAKDAQDLRYIFGSECGYSESDICQALDLVRPSLLEVITALLCRVQDTILSGLEKSVDNQEIFLDILTSLGLLVLTGSLDESDMYTLACAVDTLFSRQYSSNGDGGLFIVKHPKEDMRDTEIWYQFMWYLDEKIGGKYL